MPYNSVIFLFVNLILIFSPLYAQEKILRFNHLTADEGLSQNIVYGIEKDKYGFMWFGTWGGLNKFDGYKFTIYSANKEKPNSLPSNKILSVRKDSAGNIWVMTADSFFARYNYITDDFTRFNKTHLTPSFITFMNKSINMSHTKVSTNDYEWKGVSNFLAQTNLKTKTITYYANNIFDKWAIHINNAPWLYIDNNQILWVGSYYNGVCYADNYQKPFNYIRISNQGKEKQNILDNKVRAICKDNLGNLWIGTSENGISEYNVSSNKSTHFQYNVDDLSMARRKYYMNHIRSIYCDKYGDIWIGSGAGVRKYNPRTNKISYYWLAPENNEINIQVRSIIEDFRGNLWICTRDDIQKYDREKDMFIKYNPLKSFGINQPKFRILMEDKKKNLWVTTETTGLLNIRRDTSTGTVEKFSVTIYKYSPTNNNSIGDNCVYHIYEDESGIIWAGTGTGLSRFDPEKKQFTRFTKKRGLPDEFILGILSDGKDNIWVSHKKGLTRINSKTFAIRNYTVEDGLLSNEFMENTCYRDKKTNMLYFGSLNGLVYFNPEDMQDNPYPPKIVFTNLQIGNQFVKPNQIVNGRIILTKPIYLTKEITLRHSDKVFSIEFAALHYSNPHKNEYKYKLEGFDLNWISTDASMRYAKYSNLEPKTYILKVIASNNDGVWNEEGITLKITVIPPWWNTIWFKIILFVLIILILFLAYHIRISNYRKRQEELSLLVKKRTQELVETNNYLTESQTRIEEYAEEVTQQSEKLKETNIQLIAQKSQIEEQAEELRVHTENLKETNELLIEKQKLIEAQSNLMLQTNDQLNKLNNTKDKLMSIIAHDLKNPFHTIIGFSGLLMSKMDNLSVEKTKHYISLINNIASNGHELLENLLQWSRSQTGRITFEPVLLAPAFIAQDAMNLFESSAFAKNITLKQLIDLHTKVYADENMLRTIFRNLISNAIKFTNEKGVITTNITISNQIAKISVSDTGIGISPENIKLLFQSDSTLTTKGTSNEGGTGLGLLLCKEFVEHHNGKIWVESKEGQGSKFIFTLPLDNKI